MAAITIRGIRITSFTVTRNDEGGEDIQASYQLISSTDKVLAKESLTSKPGYGSTQFVPSPETYKAIREAVAAYRKDVETQIGLDAE